MNKENNQHWLASRLALIIFTIMAGAVCAILPTTTAMAQDAPLYKVGDRLEIDVITQNNPANARWKKATLVHVNVEGGLYTFEIDGPAGKIPQTMGIVIRSPQCCIRPIQGADAGAPKTLSQKKNEAADGTMLADREIINCDFEQPNARNGTRPPPELMKKLIRCLYEKPAQPEMDGAQTMDITEFQIGAPSKWVPLRNIGNGKPGTIIYPIRTTWTWKRFYRSGISVETGRVTVFSCFVNVFNKWECGLGQRVKDGVKTEIRVQ